MALLASKKYSPFLLFLLGVVLIELFINPIGEFSLNDDWAYARSVFVLNETGNFSIGKWPAMSLYSHTLLGLLFVKIFGFSYTVLRFSNMFLCIIALFYFYKFLYERQGVKPAIFICSVVVLNPFYLNLFNSYMTDLTFINFSFLAFYALYNYFEKKKKLLYMLLFFGMALLATFTRQIGVILFFALGVVALMEWLRNKNLFLLLSSVTFSVICLILIYYFEKDQNSQNSNDAAYQGLFFGNRNMQINSHTFFGMFTRFILMMVYSGGVFLIIGSLFLNEILKNKRHMVFCFIGPLIAIGCFLLIYNDFPVGNILYNCGLGPEGTIDRIYLEINDTHAKWNLMYLLILSNFVLGFLFMSLMFRLNSIREILENKKPLQIFLLIFLIQYCFLIGISEAFFDRYTLVFTIFLMILFFLKQPQGFNINYKLSIALLVFIGSFSVFATKDSFNASRLEISIHDKLVNEDKIPEKTIHAGFGYELWNGSLADFDWINYDHYNDKKFIMSRGPIPGFEIYKTFSYQRFVPFKTDTVFVLRKSLQIKPI